VLSILVMGVFFGATIFLGEEFDIKRIKYSHAVFGLIMFASLGVLINSELFSNADLISTTVTSSQQGMTASLAINNSAGLFSFESPIENFAFWIPIAIGFLVGPWLDIQNWQRVIQIRKENLSTSAAYIIGGLIFWAILMLDGLVALACFNHGREFYPDVLVAMSNLDPHSILFPFKATITKVLAIEPQFNYLLGFYLTFVGLGALTTFDSAYIAYKWYSESLVKDAKGLIFSVLPAKSFSSPILGFVLCIITATTTVHFAEFGKFIARFDPNLEKFFRFELEYYLAFYAAFFVIYAVALYKDISNPNITRHYSALKLFATGLSSIAVFGIGYFSTNAIVMALGSLIPFVYGFYADSKIEPVSIVNNDKPLPLLPSPNNQQDTIVISTDFAQVPAGAKSVGIKGCYYKDGWFIHHFIPTYQDTNSVGNVYFAMYLMWVGKTRELFFNHVIPGFDPKTSDYLILTRSIDHKFQKEIKEFDEVTIELKIIDYNRKFATLEHRILTASGELVGKGKQVLMFVDSKSYGLIDLPQDLQMGFLPFVGA
ncbi:MAG: acyl-CoA thioesterase, partial [Candidatus Caenarcaniphilales bacterium]|nr:acyl-CoA thioesterase [Candidatus Caenarcaniphilales bacterium]